MQATHVYWPSMPTQSPHEHQQGSMHDGKIWQMPWQQVERSRWPEWICATFLHQNEIVLIWLFSTKIEILMELHGCTLSQFQVYLNCSNTSNVGLWMCKSATSNCVKMRLIRKDWISYTKPFIKHKIDKEFNRTFAFCLHFLSQRLVTAYNVNNEGAELILNGQRNVSSHHLSFSNKVRTCWVFALGPWAPVAHSSLSLG